jgi:hypothetical protein
MSHFPETPEMESRNCSECVPVGLSGLWTAITPLPNLGSRRGLNQSCSPPRELSNAVLHSRSAPREQVDSRILVVGSQTGSLTPGPSFAHNLGCRCPNDQCEAILDIYTLRPFQWHQEHPKARCFGPCCRALNIRESRRTPTPDFSKCWASPAHLAKVGVRHECIVFIVLFAMMVVCTFIFYTMIVLFESMLRWYSLVSLIIFLIMVSIWVLIW